MDSDQRELYERGVADAAHNNLNIFYYQHYYYYRKGYDELRRSQRRRSRWTLMLLAGGMLTLLAVALYVFTQAPAPAPSADDSAMASPRPAVPTASLVSPRATEPLEELSAMHAAPTDAPINADVLKPIAIGLQPGIQALVVNVGDAPLRLRQTASLEADVVVRLDEGTLVSIIGGPVEADGYIWWELEHATGRGWGAERSLEGLPWLVASGGAIARP